MRFFFNFRKYNIVYLSYEGLKQMVSIVNNFNDNIVFPHYSTIYRFYMKFIKYNIISNTFNNLVRSYLNRTKSNSFLIDTFIEKLKILILSQL